MDPYRVLFLAIPVLVLSLDPVAMLGWEIDAAPTLDGIDSFGAQLPAGTLPLSANPDPGRVAFAKTNLVIDTGWGSRCWPASPPTARICATCF
ncbi:MAG: hypothetical protein ACH36H_12195 [Candidatus Nanopelagicales bacterium]